MLSTSKNSLSLMICLCNLQYSDSFHTNVRQPLVLHGLPFWAGSAPTARACGLFTHATLLRWYLASLARWSHGPAGTHRTSLHDNATHPLMEVARTSHYHGAYRLLVNAAARITKFPQGAFVLIRPIGLKSFRIDSEKDQPSRGKLPGEAGPSYYAKAQLPFVFRTTCPAPHVSRRTWLQQPPSITLWTF